jgi:hypothetical protein
MMIYTGTAASFEVCLMRWDGQGQDARHILMKFTTAGAHGPRNLVLSGLFVPDQREPSGSGFERQPVDLYSFIVTAERQMAHEAHLTERIVRLEEENRELRMALDGKTRPFMERASGERPTGQQAIDSGWIYSGTNAAQVLDDMERKILEYEGRGMKFGEVRRWTGAAGTNDVNDPKNWTPVGYEQFDKTYPGLTVGQGGSVTDVGLCNCGSGHPCPLGKTGAALRCTEKELSDAGFDMPTFVDGKE